MNMTAAMRTGLLSALAMIAFAANSLLCRLALKNTAVDAASFTSIRILSGALVLWLIVRLRGGSARPRGNWPSAVALFAYAAGFSFAYVTLRTAVGALLLFGAVQATMIGYGLFSGERMRGVGIVGFCLALGGLVAMLLPGLSAPPPASAMLMVGAGVAWGIYSLRGRGADDPIAVTAGNFVRAVPFALAASALTVAEFSLDGPGAAYALASGVITSGLGYAIWYTALRGLKATSAATIQLSVPVIAAAGGVVLLGEPVTLRLLLSSVAILGGIFLATTPKEGASTRRGNG